MAEMLRLEMGEVGCQRFCLCQPGRNFFSVTSMSQTAPSVTQIGQALLSQLTEPERVAGVFPLSYGQESLWFVDQMNPGSAAYNIPEGWRLRGRLDRTALEAAFNEIVRRQ